MLDYSPILAVILISVIVSSILVVLSYILALQQADTEKISSYECGFNPYSDARQKFEVQFFLVGILFIIFDLEISFLFPWTVTLSIISSFGYWTMMLFLFILTVGLYYEWKKGGLDWQ
uniref:NADH-ubiquinone oxidoreductase chain 3 n=1 Tax=Capsaspora owczarzaki TaxID=192875 RepID=M1K3B2_9EUKA|nr:NADH dehydrogenase subunit 3 [Capsaspora owczarzaki]